MAEEYGKLSLRWNKPVWILVSVSRLLLACGDWWPAYAFSLDSVLCLEVIFQWKIFLNMVWQHPVFHEAVISINHWIALVIEKQLLKLFCPLNLLSYLCEVLFNVDVLLGALAVPNLKCVHHKRGVAMKVGISILSIFLLLWVDSKHERI